MVLEPLNNEFYAYLAGFLDGEGCFQLAKHKNPRVRRGFGWMPQLSIGQTNKPYMLWLHKKIGYGCFVDRNPNYHLIFTSGHLRKLLPHILPYLKRKKEEAELLTIALRLIADRGSRREAIHDDELEVLFHKIRSYHRKFRRPPRKWK